MSYEALEAQYQRFATKYIHEITANPTYSAFNTAIFSLTATSYRFYLDALKEELLDSLNGDEFRDFLDYIGVRSYLSLLYNKRIEKVFDSIGISLKEKKPYFLQEFVEMSFLSPQEEEDFEAFHYYLHMGELDINHAETYSFATGLLNQMKADVTNENIQTVLTCFQQANAKIEQIFLEKVFPSIQQGELKLPE